MPSKAALPDLLAVVEAELQPKPRQTKKKAGK
jgi:hypothetical protein